jgi:hypothetical protein
MSRFLRGVFHVVAPSGNQRRPARQTAGYGADWQLFPVYVPSLRSKQKTSNIFLEIEIYDAQDWRFLTNHGRRDRLLAAPSGTAPTADHVVDQDRCRPDPPSM